MASAARGPKNVMVSQHNSTHARTRPRAAGAMRAGQPACAAGAAARAQTAPVAAPALRLLRHSEPVRRRSLRVTRASAAGGTNTELKICTNKYALLMRAFACTRNADACAAPRRTCRHQGSLNIADAARELAPPGVTVERTGCIGRCGSGPNLALLPSGLVISFCATPAQLAQLIERQCVGGQGTREVLHALEVRALRMHGCSVGTDVQHITAAAAGQRRCRARRPRRRGGTVHTSAGGGAAARQAPAAGQPLRCPP